jgi:hypothetical protein
MTFKKYPDIERLGHDDNREILMFPEDMLFIEEKVDGGNGSFWLEDDGSIHFGSRGRDLTLENDIKMFAMYQIWLREHLKRLESEGIKINPDYIYYIEWMQTHTIKYKNIPNVIGLDIRLKRAMNEEGTGLFLGRESREQEFNRLKIENTPLVWKGKVEELKKLAIRDLIPKSKYYDGFAEGIVIKNYTRKAREGNHQLYAKLVRDEFKEDNRAVFGNVKDKDSDTSKIIQQFCTDARIRKAVLKFTDEGDKLELKLMAKVPSFVIKDILKEEFNTIYDLYKFIDFKEMRQKVPKLCLRVISEMMEERAK